MCVGLWHFNWNITSSSALVVLEFLFLSNSVKSIMKKQITRDGWCVNGQFHRLKILITDVTKHTLILIDRFIIHFVSIVMTIVSLSLSYSFSPLDHQQGTVHEQYFSSWCINSDRLFIDAYENEKWMNVVDRLVFSYMK